MSALAAAATLFAAAAALPTEVRPGMPATEATRLTGAVRADMPGAFPDETILMGTGDHRNLVLTVCGGVVVQIDANTGSTLEHFSRQADMLRLELGTPDVKIREPDASAGAGAVEARWRTDDATWFLGVSQTGDSPLEVSYSAAMIAPPEGCAID